MRRVGRGSLGGVLGRTPFGCRRLPRCPRGSRLWAAAVAILLGTMVQSALACSPSDKPEPPRVPSITRGDIDGFWFGTYKTSQSARPDPVTDEDLLARLVDAMNKSTVDPWTVVPSIADGLDISLWLKDGRRADVWVYAEYPIDHARILRWDDSAGVYVQYAAYAPELVGLAKEIARQRLTPMEKILVAPPDGSWLEE